MALNGALTCCCRDRESYGAGGEVSGGVHLLAVKGQQVCEGLPEAVAGEWRRVPGQPGAYALEYHPAPAGARAGAFAGLV